MESWGVGFDGDEDVERHAGMHDARPLEAEKSRTGLSRPRIRLRVVSDYI